MFNIFKKTAVAPSQDIVEKVQDASVGFIDVRSRAEYRSGHADGAKNMPLETIMGRVETLKEFTEVYVICESGGRSAMAVNLLRSQGVAAVNVAGGTSAWRSARLPMA
jgi:rhodanese-related sulfurtransferase